MNGDYDFLASGFFLFLPDFPNGLGGMALFGTVKTLLTALRNRVNASGPSIISGCGFMLFSCYRAFVGWDDLCKGKKESPCPVRHYCGVSV
jgi:hypothetical protein